MNFKHDASYYHTPEFCRSDSNVLLEELTEVWLFGKTDSIANILQCPVGLQQ